MMKVADSDKYSSLFNAELITAIKSFRVQAQELFRACIIKLFAAVF
jgi:hypothetical protein